MANVETIFINEIAEKTNLPFTSVMKLKTDGVLKEPEIIDDETGQTFTSNLLIDKKSYDEFIANTAFAYVDGSFNQETNTYGYGCVIKYKDDTIELTGSGDDEDMALMRNVSGEIMGAQAAMEYCKELGVKFLYIFYDYTGIYTWAIGSWKRNKEGTKRYHEFFNKIKTTMNIDFVKLKGHSGILGNEKADKLAKKAVGN